jgi:hypothetical protein
MRHLKILGAVAFLAIALAVVGGSSAASATVLCKVKTAPCGANKMGVGEELHALWESKTKFEGGAIKIECAEATKKLKITNSGSAVTSVTAEITALTFNNCTLGTTVTVLSKGSIEYHWIEATRNGTETGTGTEITLAQAGLDCSYKTESTHLGVLFGSTTTGATATSETKAVMKKSGGAMTCPLTVTWTTNYKVDSPDTLDVMES